ncbi:MAG: ribonuclease H-like domain-containing protein [Fimbriimonadaceae bacterium]
MGFLTERTLWEQGAKTWDDFLFDPRSFKTGSASRDSVVREIERSRNALVSGVHQHFRQKLRQRHAWRALDAFPDATAYLDIETNGTAEPDNITMVGLADAEGFRCFIKGENLESFRDAISRYSVIVTFFGTGFDIPVIEKHFSHIQLDQIHVDLCPLFRGLGVRGGLKKIEKQFDIQRSEETDGLTGYDAVLMWRRHLRGQSGILERLVSYNREDCVNMIPLADHALRMMRSHVKMDHGLS